MKRIIKISTILFLFAILITLTSCNAVALKKDARKVKEIYYEEMLKEYPNIKLKYIKLKTYYGTYDGVFVASLYIDGSAKNSISHTYHLAECTFIMDDHSIIYAFKDGVMYTLSEAFNDGLIKYEDIKTIHYYHNHLPEAPKILFE